MSLRDRRALGRVYVSYAPTASLDLRLALDRRVRDGQVSDVSASGSDWALGMSAGVLF